MTGRHLSIIPILLALFLLAESAIAVAQRRIPVAPADAERKLIEKGNRQRENQDFEGAIASYQEALARNPDCLEAIFELTSAYYERGDFKKSLETALRGAEYESADLGYFYLMIGTSHDVIGERKKAEAAYREGLKIEPNSYLLHYNLAITYLGMKRLDDAMGSFKRALLLNPDHASSHIGLGQIYFAQGDRVPALLAFSRGLVLEPGSGRSEMAVGVLEQLLRGEGRSTQALPAANGAGGEGDFAAVELLLNGVRGNGASDDMPTLIERLTRVFGALAQSPPPPGTGFAAEYYTSYFAEIARRNYVEPFAYHIFQTTSRGEIPFWLQDNEYRLQEFLSWSLKVEWKREREVRWRENDRNDE